MAKIGCNICGVKCTGCQGRCRCGMTDRNVLVSNSVLSKNPDYMSNANIMKVLIKLVKQGLYDDEIINIIENTDINEINTKEIIEEKINTLGYCEYPVGSVGKGAWVKCIHCGKERFYNTGKKCEGINLSNK